MEIKYKTITVENAKVKQTIYHYLKTLSYSENYLKNLRKELGFILLNNQPVFINAVIKNKDEIKINVNPNTKTDIMQCIIPLDIVYEDDEMLVVNKSANLSCMPNRSHYTNNLSGAILNYMEKTDPNFVVRIVNRLDKDTSGLVLIAKNSLSCNFLNNPTNVQKVYYAMCSGNAQDNMYIDSNIDTLTNKDGYNVNKRITSASGKNAATNVQIIKNFDDYFLARITLKQGRTHQIRVHLSSIGHSLVGDAVYGIASPKMSHTALVCSEMQIVHPVTHKQINLSVNFPNDFNALME